MRMGESAWFKHRLPIKGKVDIVMRVSTYESKSLESFSSVDLSEAVTNARVHAWVSLSHKKDTVKKKLMDIFASISGYRWSVRLASTTLVILT